MNNIFLLILYETGIPLWVQYGTIIATLLFALATAFYAWRQHKLDKTNSKIVLYDRRLKLHNLLVTCTNDILYRPSEFKANAAKLSDISKEMKFLFDDDDLTLIADEIQEKGLTFLLISETINEEQDENKRKNILKEQKDILEWFKHEESIIDKKFHKYLKL